MCLINIRILPLLGRGEQLQIKEGYHHVKQSALPEMSPVSHHVICSGGPSVYEDFL